MKCNRIVLRMVALGLLPMLLFFVARILTAGFSAPNLVTRIEIDGIDYGPFDNIQGLEQFSSGGFPIPKDQSYARITLSRDFVTHPSLYLWAKNRMSRKSGPQNIYLITEDVHGNINSKRILELCQPLSWTIEAINPSLGGFNERIDLAVQKISVY